MADYQLTMTLNGGEANKRAVVESATVSPPADNQIQLIMKDTVDFTRRVEALEGWRWLWRGLRERGILTGGSGFEGSIVYTSCPIDSLTIPARKTQTSAAIMIDGDIAIAIAANLSIPHGATEMLEAAFTRLRESAKELSRWVA